MPLPLAIKSDQVFGRTSLGFGEVLLEKTVEKQKNGLESL
jgi:hypothetical protein